jgi:hypothetical protein
VSSTSNQTAGQRAGRNDRSIDRGERERVKGRQLLLCQKTANSLPDATAAAAATASSSTTTTMSTGFTFRCFGYTTHNHAALEHLGETLFDTNCPNLGGGSTIAIITTVVATVAFHCYDDCWIRSVGTEKNEKKKCTITTRNGGEALQV